MNYETAYNQVTTYKETIDQIENKMKDRVNRLHTVGNSVFTKHLGTQWRDTKDIRNYFLGELEWFYYYSPREQIAITEEGIKFKSDRFSTDPRARALLIPKKHLTYGEREFASLVRTVIKRRKEHEEHFQTIMADLNLIEVEGQIKELEEERRRLKNIIDRKKHKEA